MPPAGGQITFQRIRNVQTGKYVTTSVNDWFDQPLVQFGLDYRRNQHWIQSFGEDAPANRAFVNRRTGWVVDAIGGVLADQVALQQFPDGGGANQRWNPQKAADFPNSVVNDPDATVIEAVNTNLAWDVPFGHPDDGLYIQIVQQNGGANQAWILESVVVQNTFRISSAESGLYLGIDGYSWDNVDIKQLDPNRQAPVGLNLVWTYEDLGGGFFKIRSVTSNSVWDVPFGLNVPAYIGQHPENQPPTPNQAWSFQDLGNGFFSISPGSDPNFVVDLPNGSHDAGTSIQQYPKDRGNPLNQQWRLEPFNA
jgi:hypothetical protein